MNITERLFALQDVAYADFQSKLIPGIDRTCVIGVRVPLLRKLAKELCKEKETMRYLSELPHRYYDEDILHGLILSEIRDYTSCINELDTFLPFVNNWAVCDTISPKVFRNHKPELYEKITEWTKSDKTYTIRFGMEMLMKHFLDEDFKMEYLEIPANIHKEEYYVKMMQAWFFATALAKQWYDTIPYLQNDRLDVWTHNKTIQKARESFKITNDQKEYLKTLKR